MKYRAELTFADGRTIYGPLLDEKPTEEEVAKDMEKVGAVEYTIMDIDSPA